MSHKPIMATEWNADGPGGQRDTFGVIALIAAGQLFIIIPAKREM